MKKKHTINIATAFVMAAVIALTAAIAPPIPAQAAAKKLAKVTVSSVKSSSAGKVTVKWKDVSKAEGYQIAYATNSKFKNKTTKTVSGARTTSKTISGLKQGKKYYIRVRAYSKSGKKTAYGSWSSTKTETVQKKNTGNTGSTGSTGNTGSTGSTGNTGSTGSTGNTGNTASNTAGYEKYQNELISMDIPKGWKVRVVSQDNDYIGYGIRLENPKDSRYGLRFYRTMGITYTGPFYDNERAAQFLKKVYGTDYYLVNPVTPEGFFQSVIEKEKGKLKVTENLYTESLPNAGVTGVFRAIETDQNGNAAEWLCSATLTASFMNHVYDILGSYADLGVLNLVSAYGVTVIEAPVGKLDSWVEPLIHCLGTINYSSKFEDGYKEQWRQIGIISNEITQTGKQISDIIMKGWEERMK